MEFLGQWLWAVWGILAQSGPFLLLGFILAGFIKVLIPEETVYRHLGRDDFRSVFLASCLGVPLPLCSCSVIPTALALRKSGASKGATTSFLISTPETGLDSIGITWALMGPIFTIARPVAALLTALGCGVFVNLFARDRGATIAGDEGGAPSAVGNSAGSPDEESCCVESTGHSGGFRTIVVRAFRYAFGPLMADLTPWFVLGFLLSGLIVVLVPAGLLGHLLPAAFTWLTMLLMLVVGIPLYICATASTPVAAALIAKGLDPGAALVLLLAGPATNIATILFVRGFLGRRVLAIYLSGIALFSVLLGVAVNLVYGVLDIDSAGTVSAASNFSGNPLAVMGGLVLTFFLLWHGIHLGLAGKAVKILRRCCAPLGFDPTSTVSRGVLLLVLLALYGSTSFNIVAPGEVGFLERFGSVRRTLEVPGLCIHWPYPVESVTRVPAGRVRGVAFGFDPSSSSSVAPVPGFAPAPGPEQGRDVAAEAEVVTGDENLLRITYGVHYAIADAYSYHYMVEDPERVLRVLTESSLRSVVARCTCDGVLVGDRKELEHEIIVALQGELKRLGTGLAIRSVVLLDVHSPPQTHYAFRDVASAQEDRQRSVRQAEGYGVEKVSLARGRAYRMLQEAHGERFRILSRAGGEVAAFLALLGEPAALSEVNRFRLRREAAERALAKARLILQLAPDIDVYLTRRAGDAALTEEKK